MKCDRIGKPITWSDCYRGLQGNGKVSVVSLLYQVDLQLICRELKFKICPPSAVEKLTHLPIVAYMHVMLTLMDRLLIAKHTTSPYLIHVTFFI